MPVGSYPHLILSLLVVTCCIIVQGESHANRQRRQGASADNRNIGNSNGYIPPNNVQYNPSNIPASNARNDQQQSGGNLLPPSQGQGQVVRSRGFYDSPAFKPPTFSGEKPVGWFDTKYPNWVSNQNNQLDKNNMVDGKNAPPSSLLGDGIQPRREDGGAFFLQKVAKHYASRGDKGYNIGQSDGQRERGTVCTNHQNYDGYTFGKFPCPLPASTGMNQLDQFCCGPVNYQYCCNARESNLNQGNGYDNNDQNADHRHSKHSHYAPSRHRTLAIILPIAGVLVVAGALIIVLLYYKKLRSGQNKNTKSTPSNESYKVVSQVPPVEPPTPPRREQQKTTVQA